jgi:hypothetical protein
MPPRRVRRIFCAGVVAPPKRTSRIGIGVAKLGNEILIPLVPGLQMVLASKP